MPVDEGGEGLTRTASKRNTTSLTLNMCCVSAIVLLPIVGSPTSFSQTGAAVPFWAILLGSWSAAAGCKEHLASQFCNDHRHENQFRRK